MPSAGPDATQCDRFLADLNGLRAGAGIAADAPIGIALSGGPDSVALLLLTVAVTGGRVRAMTVDHGLRAEAAAEARAAAALCASLGVSHEIARPGPHPGSGGIQATARDMRYAALAEWAQRTGPAAVLTAHHADDQAETVLMRLARGSGLAGLSGIRPTQHFVRDGVAVTLLRPLLGWRKHELEAICAAAGIVPALDPSNLDGRFDRTAVRRTLADARWLDSRRIAASASHLAEAEAALAAIADERYAIERGSGFISFRPDPLREIARRHLRRLLDEEFGANPDGPSLDRALRLLAAGAGTTCADVLCAVDGPVWRFRRAPARRGS